MEPLHITEGGKSPSPTLINALPREILYYCLSLCNETYDVVNETTNLSGKRCLTINRGSGSKNFGRVCHLWKDLTEAGMVLPVPFCGIQLTDEQFFKAVTEQSMSSLPKSLVIPRSDSLQLSDLQGYKTITIICKQLDYYLGGSQSYMPFLPEGSEYPQIPAPKELNIVIIGGRTADISPIFRSFKTSHKNIHDNMHEENLASHEITGKVGNISINVWDGRIIPSSSNGFIPSLEIPSGFGRADLYINHWTDIDKINDIPWAFGQLCRNARPHTLGFHLLSPHGSALTDLWRTQKPCIYPDNTLLRKIHVTGIGSDGFLRLLQCARIEIWCVRELEVTLPVPGAIYAPELCFWDFRIFDRETWPFTTDEPGGGYWGSFTDDLDLNDFVTFPKLALKRFVDGRVREVEKGRIDVPYQIASLHKPQALIESIGVGGQEEADIEVYAGRSLRWASLRSVEVAGDLADDTKQGFERLGSFQYPPCLTVLGPQGSSCGTTAAPAVIDL